MSWKIDANVCVYSLSSTKDGEIRYIGQTTKSIKTRLAWHKTNSSKSKQPVSKWVKSVLASGFDVVITAIVENAILHKTEIELIAYHKSIGTRLLNLTDGGDGIRGYKLTPEHKKKLLDAVKNRVITPELSATLSLSRIKVWANKTKEERHAIGIKSGIKMKGRTLSEETRKKMSASRLGKPRGKYIMTDKMRAHINEMNKQNKIRRLENVA